MSVQDLATFFRRYHSLKLIQNSLAYIESPVTPPGNGVAQNSDSTTRPHLRALLSPHPPNVRRVDAKFAGEEFDDHGESLARIHPLLIDLLPVTRGIMRAVAILNAITLSGPSGNLRFWCFEETLGSFDAGFSTLLSPISISGIGELWVVRPSLDAEVWTSGLPPDAQRQGRSIPNEFVGELVVRLQINLARWGLRIALRFGTGRRLSSWVRVALATGHVNGRVRNTYSTPSVAVSSCLIPHLKMFDLVNGGQSCGPHIQLTRIEAEGVEVAE